MGFSPLLASLGSYFTPGDKNRHVIVATIDGEIHELFYNPKTNTGNPNASAGNATLGSFCGLEFVTAFYAGDDKLQHPVVVTNAGDIFAIAYKPDQFAMAGPLANVQDIVVFSGFYAGDNHLRTLIAGTGESIQEITFDSKNKISYARTLPGMFPGLTHLSGFYCDDDHSRHVIVANSRGDITDLRYSSGANAQPVSVPLGTFEDVIAIAGFYATNDKTRVVIVASAEGDLFEITYTRHGAPQVGQKPFKNIPDLRAISGFYTSDDKNRHVIVVDSTGNVIEVWYASVANGVFVTAPPLASFGMPTPQVEYVGPDVTNINTTAVSNAANSSPSGRCVALAGSPSKLYTLSDTGGMWSSVNGGVWSPEPGSPAPSLSDQSSVAVLAISPINENRVLVANGTGLWETTDGGATWSFLLDPSGIGASSEAVNGVVFDNGGRVFVALNGGVGIQQAQHDAFTFVNLNDTITAVVVSESKVWARSASSVFVSPAGGANWSAAIAIAVPAVTFKMKDRFILTATDDFAYLIGGTQGDYSSTKPHGCAVNNVLVIFNAKTQTWTTQVVTSTDKEAWQRTKKIKGPETNTCDGSSGDGEVTGQRFLRVIQLQEPMLENSIGERVQLIFGAGQEVWRARGQNDDGTITDWNWAVGTTGPGFTNRDPVHADIWDVLLDTSQGGRTAWLACDGGVYTTTVAEVNYEFSKVKWKPAMEDLHTHQIQSLTVLRVNQISEPRIVYAIGDNSAFFRDTSATTLPFQQWQSYDGFGDGNFTAGDSSAPSFAWMARNIKYETFLKFGSNPKSASTPKSAWLINPKDGTFVDPSVPTRFRFVPSPVDEGQFTSADAVMMVDLPLVAYGTGDPFAQQPGPSSNGLPVLIRNKSFDKNPDINASNAKGKGWVVERGTLPAGCVGFAVSGDRGQPVYYAFTNSTLFAERKGTWTSIASNLVESQAADGTLLRTFGSVFPNPYDRNVVYVLTTDNCVQVSNQAGDNFQPDKQLNTLLNSEPGDVNQMAFNYDLPSSVVVGTESGKLFFSSGGGVWKDLTGFLPSMPVAIRSVAIDCEAIYVGTHGRGLLRVRHYSMS